MNENKDVLVCTGLEEKGYGTYYKIVAQDRSLSIEAKGIYGYFRSYAGSGITAFPGVEKILFDLCISRSRYYRHLKLLTDAGYVKVEQVKDGGKFSHNIYKMPIEIMSSKQKRSIKYKIKPRTQNESTAPRTHFEHTENETTQNGTTQNDTTNTNNLNINNLNINKYKREIDFNKMFDEVPAATLVDMNYAMKKLNETTIEIINPEAWFREVLRNEAKNGASRIPKFTPTRGYNKSEKEKTKPSKYDKFYL